MLSRIGIFQGRGFFWIAFAVALSGCTVPVKLPPATDPVPLIDPLPLTAEVKYADALIHHKVTKPGGWFKNCLSMYGSGWEVSLGPPTIERFDRAYEAIFERISGRAGDPVEGPPPDIAIWQTLRDFKLACGPTEQRFMAMACSAIITYEITAKLNKDSNSQTWMITGKASAYSGPAILGAFLLAEPHCAPLRGKAIEAAIRDAEARFIKALWESELALQWSQP